MSVTATRLSIFGEPEVKTFRLSELLGSVRRALAHDFMGCYRIVAEVAGVSRNRSGHYYFELTESDNRGQKVASTRATLWAGPAEGIIARFQEVTGSVPKEGMELLLTVRVSFHEQYGFSLNIVDIDPEHTLGNLARIKQESIKRLEAAGILDLNKVQCPLPTLVQRIAVISSTTAAGWGDFRDQIGKSTIAPLLHFELFPATMQGAATTSTVIAALDRIHNRSGDFDAVIILRGGGSPIDLSAFDDYQLCEYIANFSLPVITAIGHERDVSVADYVANTSVKTPTAAAEFLIHRLEEQINRVEDTGDRLSRLLRERTYEMQKQLIDYPERFRRLLHSLDSRESEWLRRGEHRLTKVLLGHKDRLSTRVDALDHRITSLLYDQRTLLGTQSVTLDGDKRRLTTLLRRLTPDILQMLDHYEQLATLYNPEAIMKRGFLPVKQGDKLIHCNDEVDPSGDLIILTLDGRIESTITKITNDTRE